MLPNVSNALKIPGWTSEAELLWLATQASTRTRIVEIGCWKGRSTRAMAENTLGTVYAVDTWKGTEADGHFKELDGKSEHWLIKEFFKNLWTLQPFNVCAARMPSIQGADFLKSEGSFDMIFIDAAHDYASVKADIEFWLPLLAPGGLFCGHDYDRGRPGVVQAVDEAFGKIDRGPGSIWIKR